jgi:hypothetical protein
MTKVEFQKIVADGERLTIEFKRSETALTNSLFETFSNCYAEHLLLDVAPARKCTIL